MKKENPKMKQKEVKPLGRPLKGYPPPFDCTADVLVNRMFAIAKPVTSREPKTRRKRN